MTAAAATAKSVSPPLYPVPSVMSKVARQPTITARPIQAASFTPVVGASTAADPERGQEGADQQGVDPGVGADRELRPEHARLPEVGPPEGHGDDGGDDDRGDLARPTPGARGT